MTIKRCYPVLVGASVAENQLCNGETVTVTSGHKCYLKKNGTESLGASTGTAITGLTSGSDMVIDLTQMLGSSIADYVYSLEQATAGSGIAWLRSYGFLTDDYVPYNAGTIESVEATAKVVRDENGENAVTYPLGSDVLRGLFKLDANNNLYADGDTKTSDGTVTRKYGVLTASELIANYSYFNADKHLYSSYIRGSLNTVINQTPCNAICNIMNVGATWAQMQAFDGTEVIGGLYHASSWNYTRVYLCLPSTVITREQAETWLTSNNINIVYELATPTTEQSTSFVSAQTVYPDGTERFVTENGVPVGHETSYQL